MACYPLTNRQIARSPDRQIARSPDRQIARLPDRQIACTFVVAVSTSHFACALFKDSFKTEQLIAHNAPPQHRQQTSGQKLYLAYHLKILRINSSVTSTLATNNSHMCPSLASCVSLFKFFVGLRCRNAFYL